MDLLTSGGSFGLAVVFVYWQRQDVQKLLENERADKERILTALEKNTAALTELSVLVRSVYGRPTARPPAGLRAADDQGC